jgi:hypothetical protein
MNWLYKLSQVVGILLAAAGVVLIVLAALNSKTLSSLYFTGGVLIVVGIITFIINTFFAKMFKGFPKMPGFGESIKQGAQKMSSAADFLKHQNLINKLSSVGIPVKVKVLSVKDTGQLINYDPVLEFQLEVIKEHRYDNYYINNHQQMVSKIIAPRIQTGNEYNAKVDPVDRNSIYVSWM